MLVAVVAALLSTGLFGLPLGGVAAQFFLDAERNDAERAAQAAAVGAAADLARGQRPSELEGGDESVVLGLYGQDGALLVGDGPRRADATVDAALRGTVSSDSDVRGSLVVAVPVTDGDRSTVAAVAATTGYAEVRWQIIGTWAVMLAIALAALAIALALAQRQARRLAAPLEELSAAAQRLGEGDFSVRARASGIPEIDAASASLGTTAGRLGVLVRQERQLAAHASHQLRTPLTALRLVLETAADQSPQVQTEAVVTALEAADRLERTIDDLLLLAHDDDPAPDRLDLAVLVGEAAATASLGLRAAGRALAVDVGRDLPDALGSAAAVRQVLAVLLDNATVHGAGTVSITVREASGALAVDVGDRGRGVADASMPFAGHAAHARRESRAGTDSGGIGLGLARTLAEDQGGRLVLTRARPAVFTLLLPTDAEPDGSVREAGGRAAGAALLGRAAAGGRQAAVTGARTVVAQGRAVAAQAPAAALRGSAAPARALAAGRRAAARAAARGGAVVASVGSATAGRARRGAGACRAVVVAVRRGARRDRSRPADD